MELIEKKFSAFSNAYMILGNIWSSRKDYQKAIENYEKVISTSPHGHIEDISEK